MTGVAGAGGARQGILSLAIKDKGALYNAYMPLVQGGGIFVPTAKRDSRGDGGDTIIWHNGLHRCCPLPDPAPV